MFESFGFETLTAPQAAVFYALILGALFGLLAERTKFCFRRGLVGEDRKQAMGVWVTALAVALAGTQGAVALGWITLEDHRFLAADLPVLAIVLGGLLFGAGMVLTRGCVARLTVLGASGNLRALTVLIVFAVVAHASMKGILAPLRTALSGVTVPLGGALPGNPLVWTALLVIGLLALALRSGNRGLPLAGGALIGLLVPLGWVGTGFVLYDDFDPVALESLSFTAPFADALFWTIASTAISANFGVGLIGGVLAGALVSALVFGSFRWQSFSAPRETGRYLAGAVLMGTGATLAGGCTVGAGLSGIPTLSVAAIVTLGSIAVGALAVNAGLGRSLSPSRGESAGSSATQSALPAE